MQFSDTTNKNGIIQRVEDYAGFSDGTITGDTTFLKKVTAHVNETLHELTSDLMLLQDDFDWDDPYKADYPIATTPLVEDQRDYQFEGISFLKLKRVDITYDGTNWYRATPFDSTSFTEGFGNDTKVDENFEKTAPMYDPKAFGFWLYPRASAEDVAAGAKARIEFSRSFDEFEYTDTTTEPPIDRPWHDLIAIGTALKLPNLNAEQFTKLQPRYAEGRALMKRAYSRRNEDQVLSFKQSLLNEYT